MRHQTFTQRGFTIVELIIVIAVIAILMAVTAIAYNGIQQGARDRSLQSDSEKVAAEVARFGTMKNSGVYGPGVEWSSIGTSNSNISFTPSEGNVIDVVASDKEYCVRSFNPGSTYKTIDTAYSKGSSPSACTLLLPSNSSGGSGGRAVGLWKLNGNTNDESETARHGTGFSLTPGTNKAGEANMAYDFNGTNSYISLGTGANYDYPSFSVSVWAKSIGIPGHIRNLIGKGSWNSAADWFIGFKSGTHASFVYGIGWTAGPSYPFTSFSPTEWRHYTGTVSPTQQKLYIDGALVATVNTSHGTIVNTYDLQVGRGSYNASFFNGTIDDIRLYNAELPASMVSDIYRIGPQ